ncbi:MAG: DUF192 domain-containing protein [Pseudomonadota bacterium]
MTGRGAPHSDATNPHPVGRAARDRRTVLAAALAMLTLAGLPLSGAQAEAPACSATQVTVMTAEPVRYDVELALTAAEQAQGLMFRTEMAVDAGMLFVFDPPRPASFWMRNTFISLDMIFVDAAGQVLNVAERTVPFSETPHRSTGDARAVLEVNAGEAARHGIVPGTQLVHPAFGEAPDPFRCPG